MFFVMQDREEMWDVDTGMRIGVSILFKMITASRPNGRNELLADYSSEENARAAFKQLIHDLDLLGQIVYLETDEEIAEDRKRRERKRI